MSGFAINIDLTSYFEDLRKYASIFVDGTKCKEVGDVENHIKTIFNLEDNICLLNKKCLIPRSENISILQQYDMLKIQKCDFFDYQIHKGKKSNSLSDQPALNLIQSDRTIDLSCRPKQRFKTISCRNHCVLEAPKTPIISTPQPIEHIGADLLSDVQTKPKTTKKKRCDSGLKVSADNACPEQILDMSVKKLKKKKKHYITEVNGTQSIETSPAGAPKFECDGEITREHNKKLKKRKRVTQYEDCDLVDTCWDNLVSDDKKRKITLRNCINMEEGLAKDLRISENNNVIENSDGECESRNNTVYSHPGKCNKRSEKSLDLQANTQIIDDKDIPKTFEAEDSSSKKCIEIYKRGLEEKVNTLLKNLDFENSQSNLIEKECLNEITNTGLTQESTNNNCDEEVMSTETNITDTSVKRNRIRKHNKRRKRERREYMAAVAPALKRMNETQPTNVYPTDSEKIRQHVYFSDGELDEEMDLAEKPKSTPYSSSRDVSTNEPINEGQQVTNVSVEQPSTEKVHSWQQELLKLTNTSKPVVFHRNAQISTISDKTESPLKQLQQNTMTDLSIQHCKEAEQNEFANKSSNDFLRCPKEQEFLNCNGARNKKPVDIAETILKTQNATTDSLCESKAVKPNLQNVNVAGYPIINRVKDGDLILYKVLKLSETYEPVCSNTILAKVKRAGQGSDKLHLQIIEGFDECDPLTRVCEIEEDFTVELGWSEMIEPRLFFP